MPQVIATSIVSSFTEHNCHLAMNPMVPTILIDREKFRVILYDCKKRHFIDVVLKNANQSQKKLTDRLAH